jgi:aspartate carbamoyltransferase catalytic subunit
MEHFDGKIDGKNIAIVGDILNSRVASSNLQLLPRFGLNPILVAPTIFRVESEYKTVTDINQVIDELDVIMSLRVQHERHNFDLLPEQLEEEKQKYAQEYCITKELMGKRDILLMHPGPVNRNIDISDEMLEDPRCKVLRQVTNGVAVRMAILKKLILQGK